MKKIKKQRLVLSREIVRSLDLQKVNGAINGTTFGCTVGCTRLCQSAANPFSGCTSCPSAGANSACCLSTPCVVG